MNKTHWLGVVAMSLMSAAALSGCSGDDVPPAGTAGAPPATAGTGTTGGSGGSGTSGTGGGATAGGPTGMQQRSPDYFVILSGADAMPGMPAPGKYTGLACDGCHGANGEGKASLGSEIRFTPKEYLTAVVRGGRNDPINPAMPTLMSPFPEATLPAADLDAIAAWVASLPKPTTGEGLYKAMCGNCHGSKMATGGSAPVSIMGKTKAQVAKLVREGSGTDFKDRKKYMPKYDTTLLSDTELASIQTYLGSM